MNQSLKQLRLMRHHKQPPKRPPKSSVFTLSTKTLAKHLQSPLIICQICQKKLVAMAYVIAQSKRVCVGCFSKNLGEFRKSRGYQVANFSRKRKGIPISLEKEVKVLQTIEKYGVDSIQLLCMSLENEVSEQQIRKYIEHFIKSQKKVKHRSPKSANSSEQETENKPRQREENSPYCSLDFQQKDYKISDYFLACLHEKSDPEVFNFLTMCKLKQISQRIEIEKRIVQLYQGKNQRAKWGREDERFTRTARKGQIIDRLQSEISQSFYSLKETLSEKTESVSMDNFKEMIFQIDLPNGVRKEGKTKKKRIHKVRKSKTRIP